MNNNISRRKYRRVVEPWILVDRYDAVTPFGKKVQEGAPPLPPMPWRDGSLARFKDVNVRRLTSWRWSTGTMEIVALPGSTLLLSWNFKHLRGWIWSGRWCIFLPQACTTNQWFVPRRRGNVGASNPLPTICSPH